MTAPVTDVAGRVRKKYERTTSAAATFGEQMATVQEGKLGEVAQVFINPKKREKGRTATILAQVCLV